MRDWTIPDRAEYSVPQSVSVCWHARHMKCARRYLQHVSGDDRGTAMVPIRATPPWGRAIDGLCANAANRAWFWVAPLLGRKSAHHQNDLTWGRRNSGTCTPVLHATRIMQIGNASRRAPTLPLRRHTKVGYGASRSTATPPVPMSKVMKC